MGLLLRNVSAHAPAVCALVTSLMLFSGCDFVARYAPDLAGYSLAPSFEPLPESMLAAAAPAAPAAGMAAAPQVFRTLEGHEGEVTSLAFSPDGKLLISASYGDYSIMIWNVEEGREVSRAQSPARPTSMALSPDGTVLITTDVKGAITFWPVEGGQLGTPLAIKAGIGHVGSVVVSPNGQLFATASFDKLVLIGDLRSRMLIRRIDTPEPMRGIAFSPEGDMLAAGSDTNTFTLWRLKEGKGRTYTIPKVDKKSNVNTVAYSPDGNRLSTGHMDSSITVWDPRRGKELHNYYVSNASTWSLAYSTDGKVLATAQENGVLYLWDSETARQLAALKGHTGAVRSLAFSPDGSLASGGQDKKIIIWR